MKTLLLFTTLLVNCAFAQGLVGTERPYNFSSEFILPADSPDFKYWDNVRDSDYTFGYGYFDAPLKKEFVYETLSQAKASLVTLANDFSAGVVTDDIIQEIIYADACNAKKNGKYGVKYIGQYSKKHTQPYKFDQVKEQLKLGKLKIKSAKLNEFFNGSSFSASFTVDLWVPCVIEQQYTEDFNDYDTLEELQKVILPNNLFRSPW